MKNIQKLALVAMLSALSTGAMASDDEGSGYKGDVSSFAGMGLVPPPSVGGGFGLAPMASRDEDPEVARRKKWDEMVAMYGSAENFRMFEPELAASLEPKKPSVGAGGGGGYGYPHASWMSDGGEEFDEKELKSYDKPSAGPMAAIMSEAPLDESPKAKVDRLTRDLAAASKGGNPLKGPKEGIDAMDYAKLKIALKAAKRSL